MDAAATPSHAAVPAEAAAILRVIDAERDRIGADLHDDMGQILTGIGLHLGALKKRLASRFGDADTLEAVSTLEGLLDRARESCRRLTRGYVAPHSSSSLLAMLEQLAADVPEPIRCTARLQVLPGGTASTLAADLYRIAQEAVTNAVRHSGATRILIELLISAGQVLLSIEDDGCGITSEPRTGLGLPGMHTRAARFGGTVAISPRPGGGTRVEVSFPAEAVEPPDPGSRAPLGLIWRAEYESGNPTIDTQHRDLFVLANALIAEASQSTPQPAVVQRLLDDVFAHVALHFGTEEQLLGDHGYAALDQHRRAHRALLARAQELRRDAAAGTITLGALVEYLARDVVARHVLDADRDYFGLFPRSDAS